MTTTNRQAIGMAADAYLARAREGLLDVESLRQLERSFRKRKAKPQDPVARFALAQSKRLTELVTQGTHPDVAREQVRREFAGRRPAATKPIAKRPEPRRATEDRDFAAKCAKLDAMIKRHKVVMQELRQQEARQRSDDAERQAGRAAAATHEAGHAVAAAALNCFRRAAISDRGYSGMTDFQGLLSAVNYATVGIAGPLAEARANGSDDWRRYASGPDLTNLHGISDDVLRRAEEKAGAILQTKRFAVAHVAQKLLDQGSVSAADLRFVVGRLNHQRDPRLR